MALPMIHDKEGRVNEYEMKTLEDIMPGSGKFQGTEAQNRQAWIQFMKQKQATPIANSFGIRIPQNSAGSVVKPR
jgi:hypothetical protein